MCVLNRACEDLGEGSTDHSLPIHNAYIKKQGKKKRDEFICSLKRRPARAHELHSLGQDQTTVAQRTETILDERSLTSCV